MKVSICAWSFPELTLGEVARIAQAIGVGGLDVSLFCASGLDKQQVLSAPEDAARAVRSHGLQMPSYFHTLGEEAGEPNPAAPAVREANLRDLNSVARFCAAAEIPTVVLLPGALSPGQDRTAALATTSEFLAQAVEIVSEHGVTLTVEPCVHGIIESPAATLELLNAVPGLRLTLDYSHFICGGSTQAEVDVLVPHAAHVHLRQARVGWVQERMEDGSIDFNALFTALAEQEYSGWLALEPVRRDLLGPLLRDGIDSPDVDLMTEVIKLRNAADAWSKRDAAMTTAL